MPGPVNPIRSCLSQSSGLSLRAGLVLLSAPSSMPLPRPGQPAICLPLRDNALTSRSYRYRNQAVTNTNTTTNILIVYRRHHHHAACVVFSLVPFRLKPDSTSTVTKTPRTPPGPPDSTVQLQVHRYPPPAPACPSTYLEPLLTHALKHAPAPVTRRVPTIRSRRGRPSPVKEHDGPPPFPLLPYTLKFGTALSSATFLVVSSFPTVLCFPQEADSSTLCPAT